MKLIRRICLLIIFAVLMILQKAQREETEQIKQLTLNRTAVHQQTVVHEELSTLRQVAEELKQRKIERKALIESNKAKTEEEQEPEEAVALTIEYPVWYGGCGTVKSIDGTTAVVTVFASDSESSWNWYNDSDLQTYSQAYRGLMEASEWLEEEAGYWGAETVIVSDWMENRDLYYEAYFEEDMLKEDSQTYNPLSRFIDNSIDTAGIVQRYNADSIVYVFCFNGCDTDEVWAYAYPDFSNESGSVWYNEIIVINCSRPGSVLGAGTFAHELLHTYGLPDMYYADERISQEYVDYLDDIQSQEIMFDHSDWDYYGIRPGFTQLDAYYLGLCEEADDLETWNLGRAVYYD